MTFPCSPFLQTVTFPAALLCVSRRPPDNWRRQERRGRRPRGRKKSDKVQLRASLLLFPLSFLPSLLRFPRDIYKSLRFHTKKESLGSRKSCPTTNVCGHVCTFSFIEPKTVMCFIFTITCNSNPRCCPWFMLVVVLIALAVVRQKIGSSQSVHYSG